MFVCYKCDVQALLCNLSVNVSWQKIAEYLQMINLPSSDVPQPRMSIPNLTDSSSTASPDLICQALTLPNGPK